MDLTAFLQTGSVGRFAGQLRAVARLREMAGAQFSGQKPDHRPNVRNAHFLDVRVFIFAELLCYTQLLWPKSID